MSDNTSVVRLVVLHVFEYWLAIEAHERRLAVMEIEMLHWTSGIRNEDIRDRSWKNSEGGVFDGMNIHADEHSVAKIGVSMEVNQKTDRNNNSLIR